MEHPREIIDSVLFGCVCERRFVDRFPRTFQARSPPLMKLAEVPLGGLADKNVQVALFDAGLAVIQRLPVHLMGKAHGAKDVRLNQLDDL
eukprot:CAMPEP_0194544086 /NCGR_PEP_ID=MMETSP0253-20130528/86900_1 /TAXON_ID=2966 /ORGANISM="Noctiluca scintillans" /LENGTH=89 /DNA_ID=CAMNT_0039390919 /DNA_START=51 /DNA_END=320 /DNA_ORIENTATION=+